MQKFELIWCGQYHLPQRTQTMVPTGQAGAQCLPPPQCQSWLGGICQVSIHTTHILQNVWRRKSCENMPEAQAHDHCIAKLYVNFIPLASSFFFPLWPGEITAKLLASVRILKISHSLLVSQTDTGSWYKSFSTTTVGLKIQNKCLTK